MTERMSYQHFSTYIRADLYRYTGQTGWRSFWPNVLLRAGFKYTYLMRLCRFLYGKRLWLPLYVVAKVLLRHYRFRYGIDIPAMTQVGPGLYIGHSGGIVVNTEAIIGKNCNLSPNTVIGQVNRGPNRGVPTIGDYVYIGPNVNIIGNISVGHHVAIGAGAVVTKDVPDYGVAVGVPAKVVSYEGSTGYINHVLPETETVQPTSTAAVDSAV